MNSKRSVHFARFTFDKVVNKEIFIKIFCKIFSFTGRLDSEYYQAKFD